MVCRAARRELLEPMVHVTLLCPSEYAGPLIALCEEKDGTQLEQTYLGGIAGLAPLAPSISRSHVRPSACRQASGRFSSTRCLLLRSPPSSTTA